MRQRLWRFLVGRPRELRERGLFERLSLAAFLAWVGLGADGISSSAYGPDQAFRALGGRDYLALALACATAFTVFVISYAYTRIIEHFPHGGGGYVVSTKLLGPRAGVLSGCALLVDYMLTITVSIASGTDAVFSFLPPGAARVKLPVEMVVVLFLVVLNLRGVRESVRALAPIFVLFIACHAILVLGGIGLGVPHLGAIAHRVRVEHQESVREIGRWGLFVLLLRAYSIGGGTYTGIEAVSNGILIMREPKVRTAKRTMVYLAVSLAFTAGGILIGYLLFAVRPAPQQTLNAVLARAVGVGLFGAGGGHVFRIVTLISEGLLLLVAAQTGFIDGPRVMASMAVDHWLPHRLSSLSSRLAMQNGVFVIGAFAFGLLLYTHGHVDTLVVLYAINVFATFSLSQLGMARMWIGKRRSAPRAWARELSIHGVGLILCVSILAVTLGLKFTEGAWLTVVVTFGLVALCFAIHAHYASALGSLAHLTEDLSALPGLLPPERQAVGPPVPGETVAVLLVRGLTGIGIHALLTIQRLFSGYRAAVFVSVGVIDSGNYKGGAELDALERKVAEDLDRYVELAQRMGLRAAARWTIATDVVPAAERLCLELAREYPRAAFFAGRLVFERERWHQRMLHNHIANELQRRLQLHDLPLVILPVRVPARRVHPKKT